VSAPRARESDASGALDVLIVGAGPTGLTAAICLARHGVAFRIVDCATEPPADRSRAVAVQPRTLELFDDLGIVREALAAGMMVEAVNLVRPSGRRGTLELARAATRDSVYHGILAIPQETTERLLRERLTRDGSHRVEQGLTLTALTQDTAGVVATLTRADGSAERVRTRWIVGADGAHSAVRHLCGLPFSGITYHDEGQIGDVVVDWGLPENEVSLCPRADGFMLAFPLPGRHHFRVIIIRPRPGVTDDRHLTLDEFRESITHMTPHGCGADGGPPHVEDARWVTRYRLHRRGVPSFQRGRAFVGGDAAHIHSPVGAQGMNTGIQDAYNLAWKLALVTRGEAPLWVVETYDEERRHIGEILLNGTDRFFGAIAGHGWLPRMLRRVAPTLAARLLGTPFVRRRLARFVSQLGVRYRHSRLSVEGAHSRMLGGRAPRAGDRAPDVPLARGDGTPMRLFDVLRGPEHVLVVFAGTHAGTHAATTSDLAEIVRRVREELGALVRVAVIRPRASGDVAAAPIGFGIEHDDAVDAIDADGTAHARYGASRGASYLVRPDGYVAFRDTLDDTRPLFADIQRRFVARRAGEGRLRSP
jgi:2-polyprenyl-6-methoxyphenol hydroxylase-like FAD-dependent oxidoreductase